MNKCKILPLLKLLLFDVGGDLPIRISYQPGVRSQIIVFMENLELHWKSNVFNFIALQGDVLFLQWVKTILTYTESLYSSCLNLIFAFFRYLSSSFWMGDVNLDCQFCSESYKF